MKALQRQPMPKFPWHLRLYVRGGTASGFAAVENLRVIVREHLDGSCHFEVIDISKDSRRAGEDDIVAVPTLIRLSPQPPRRIVGDLTRTERVLQALEIPRPLKAA